MWCCRQGKKAPARGRGDVGLRWDLCDAENREAPPVAGFGRESDGLRGSMWGG